MDYTQLKLINILLLVMMALVTHMKFIDAYGFDSAASCDPKSSRRARAHIISSIPCDLSQTGYCNLPGNLYPWHAVRRFVTENQGLMKRMYGDLRHISVLKTEIDNNGIDGVDIERTAERYSRKAQKKSKYMRQEFQNSRNNDVISEPHFRPTSTSTTSTTSTTPAATTMTSSSTTPSSASSPQVTAENKFLNDLENVEIVLEELIDASIESNSVVLNFTSAEMDSDNIEVIQPPNLSLLNATTAVDTSTISSTLKKITSLHADDDVAEESSTKPTTTTSQNRSTFESTDEEIEITTTTSTADESITSPNVATYNAHMEKLGETDDENEKSNNPSALIANMEGQLFQDVVQKDSSQTVHFRGKGINACPVKEEVVAPFWANNTRGEVLALLNLYPFEQYVHWEKCTHEDKQMYCRDGCRCEQQYSLHRLLAYDPNNDCRGIFSDWFRFPSCCVCKCYNIPGLEFRGTSRSPRSADNTSRHPADVAEEELRRAIYDHATEEWYRP